MSIGANLLRGESGEAVRDLQQRLIALGFDLALDELGRFGLTTEAALRSFQAARGLHADGVCGRQTWAALVESSFSLGDRLLYYRRPMLRGDDVGELQRLLNALGFDAGREDAILGQQTAHALNEFQRNAGIALDGICGPSTLAALRRLGSLAAGSIAAVREREALRRRPRDLAGRRVFVAAALGFDSLADTVARGLAACGAETLLDTAGDEDPIVASAANRYGAELFVALQFGDAPGCRCAYFASGRFRSEAGFRLATAMQEELTKLGMTDARACGRAFPLLRETRMTAVVCEPVERGNPSGMRDLVERSGDIGRALIHGVRRAVEEPDFDS